MVSRKCIISFNHNMIVVIVCVKKRMMKYGMGYNDNWLVITVVKCISRMWRRFYTFFYSNCLGVSIYPTDTKQQPTSTKLKHTWTKSISVFCIFVLCHVFPFYGKRMLWLWLCNFLYFYSIHKLTHGYIKIIH